MNIRTNQSQEEPRLLRRPSGGRILGGVAAGLAAYFAVDVAHVRIILVALSFLGRCSRSALPGRVVADP